VYRWVGATSPVSGTAARGGSELGDGTLAIVRSEIDSAKCGNVERFGSVVQGVAHVGALIAGALGSKESGKTGRIVQEEKNRSYY